jgi:FtsZ-binding cell division protein ZapB
MIVANFTPDPILWKHMGITGTIPGLKEGSTNHVVEMDNARARHILNAFEKIGLVQMQFGDDPELKEKESMAQYQRFWEHQIEVFNQNNEQQKEQGNRYSKPTDLLELKAKELGLELKKPWMVPVKDDAVMKTLRDENAELKASNKEQGKQIAQILAMLEGKGAGAPGPGPVKTSEPVPVPEEPIKASEPDITSDIVATNRKKYASLTEKTFKGWLKNNWDEVQAMPEENRFEIKTKYQELYETPFPAENPT